MYAIVETGGKQVKAEVGEVVYVEKLDGEVGSSIILDKVLYIDSDKVSVGTPYVNGAKVKCSILKQSRGKKIRVLRYRAKNNVRVKRGHRQPFTALKVEAITTK